MLFCCLKWSFSQAVLKVSYNEISETVFLVDSPSNQALTIFDRIDLAPITTKDSVIKTIFANGKCKSLIYHLQYRKTEDWIPKTYLTEITFDSIFKYDTNGEKIYASVDSQSNQYTGHEIAPYYMAEPPYHVFPDSFIYYLTENGYSVYSNNDSLISFEDSTESYYYNSKLNTEITQKKITDERLPGVFITENDITTNVYTPGDHGLNYYNYILNRRSLKINNKCVERLTVKTYSNFSRIFFDSTYLPLMSENQSNVKFTVTIYQNQNQINISRTGDFTNTLYFNIIDFSGTVILSNQQLDGSQGWFDLPTNTPAGIYYFIPINIVTMA